MTLTNLIASAIGADADDTAKAIYALSLLGIRFSPESLIREYEAADHFRTYASETHPSVSANTNVLIALLHGLDPNVYSRQIEKCVNFLCSEWLNNDHFNDKWVRRD